MYTRVLKVIVASLCVLSGSALAQDGKLPWQEYSRLIQQGREIAPLDAGGMFGDKVDLYSGALSFSATDVSIAGNSGLPVAITRKLDIHDRDKYGSGGRGQAFADWDIDIPSVGGVFATNWHDSRCTQASPPTISARIVGDEYWSGNHASLPGGGEMLQANITRPQPTTGGPYVWLTEGDTYFSCLSTINNGTGQGFLAIDKDGNKYWLDHMAQYVEPPYTNVDMHASPQRLTTQRRKNVLYATRVEDRFGNWVTYTYSNAWNQPVRLTAINSNDSRSLTLQYNPSGFVSTVSDGTRTWTYSYASNSLTGVALPDGSNWTMNLAALSGAMIQQSNDPNDMRTCFSEDFVLSGDASGSITHPSGATATFVVGPQDIGRSNVPGICRNYAPPGTPSNDTRDDFPVFPVRWVSLAVRSKQVQGPGLSPLLWTYAMGGGWSWQYPAGQTQPVCQTQSCADPICLDDNCAGKRIITITGPDNDWERYTFGSSYRYDEGKLLMHERGDGPSAVLRTVINSYNYATSGQPYAARIGTSPQPRGAGFTSEYPRPQVRTDTVQDDALFTWQVDKGCTAPGVYCLDALMRPTRVIRTGSTAGGGGGGPTVPPSSAPTLTAPATSNTGSYTLSWTAVVLSTSYELQEQAASGTWHSIQISGGTSASIDSNPAGTWNYRVRACNNNGCAGWSTTQTVVVTLPPSGVPVLTAPSANTTGSYTVSWTNVSGATRYELDQRKDGGAWSNIHNASTISRALSGQAAGSYDYRVRACNVAGCSAYSVVASTVVSVVVLGVPTLSAPSPVNRGALFMVSWTAVSGATQYVLEYTFNGTAYTAYTGAAVSAQAEHYTAGTYRYRVKACNGSGCGNYSSEKVVVVKQGTIERAPLDGAE